MRANCLLNTKTIHSRRDRITEHADIKAGRNIPAMEINVYCPCIYFGELRARVESTFHYCSHRRWHIEARDNKSTLCSGHKKNMAIIKACILQHGVSR